MIPPSLARTFCVGVLLVCLFGMATAETLPRIEVYPKPAHGGEDVYFCIEWDMLPTIPTETLLNVIYVNNKRLETELITPLSNKVVLKGKAPKTFDWRSVKLRINGQDYPAGPDDPYMICDAPFRVKSDQTALPISATFHDADEDDVQLQFVNVFNDATGGLVASYPVWEWINDPYHYYIFDDLNASNFNCSAGDTAWIKVVLHCDDHDFPFIPEEYTFTQHLKVRVGRDLPSVDGWYYGDVHTHSQYTNNIYEYGGPLEMFAAAADAIGLSFVTVSDHSCDFDASGTLWQEMADLCAFYSSDNVRLYPAEEVTLDDNEIDNTVDNRIHFLNYSGEFIRGPESPISGTLDTSNRFTFLSEALAQMEISGGFGYAAHPFQDFDPFVALLGMAMMTWTDENYTIGRSSQAFSGLELWNERNRYKKDVSYWYDLNPFPWENNPNWQFECSWITDGIAQWDEFLSAGLTQNQSVSALLPQKLFVSAGSDCHGDFNYRTYNTDPIFFDVYATDNAFGALRTAVNVPGYPPGTVPPIEELVTAYRLGHSIMTDGPFLSFGLDVNADGDLDDPEDVLIGDDAVIFSDQAAVSQLLFRWESTEDWGTVDAIQLYQGTSATGSAPNAVWSHSPNSYYGSESVSLADVTEIPTEGWIYFRAEAFGSPLPDDARHVVTNPIWVRVDNTPIASIHLTPASELIFIPQNGGDFDYTIQAQNHQSSTTNCDIWLDVVLPDNSVYPLLNTNLSLPPGATIERQRTQAVPASAPPGNYVYRAHIGIYPDAWSTDAFLFTKLGSTSAGDQQSGWRSSGERFTTSGMQETAQVADQELSSLQVFPTPFNAVTNFSFNLSQAARVHLDIYDISGSCIITLLDSCLPAGEHTAQWEAKGIPTGIYVYRFRVNGIQQTGKTILLK